MSDDDDLEEFGLAHGRAAKAEPAASTSQKRGYLDLVKWPDEDPSLTLGNTRSTQDASDLAAWIHRCVNDRLSPPRMVDVHQLVRHAQDGPLIFRADLNGASTREDCAFWANLIVDFCRRDCAAQGRRTSYSVRLSDSLGRVAMSYSLMLEPPAGAP